MDPQPVSTFSISGLIQRRHLDYLLPFLVISVASVLYALTLLTGVGYAGDTAKFQFLGYHYGTPHETGYPLYMMALAAGTHLLPVASIALRANLLSFMFGIATLVVLYTTMRLLKISRSSSLIALSAFAFGGSFWSQAIIAEVYTLHTLLVGLTIYFLLRWHLQGHFRWFIGFSFIYSLSFGNHGTVIFLLPAIIYLVWQTDRPIFLNIRAISVVAAAVILGASQYLYVILRSMDPNAVYVEMSATNGSEFWYYISGGQFRDRMFHHPWNWFVFVKIPFFVELLWREYYALLPMILAGMALIRRPIVGLFLLLMIISVYLFSGGYAIPDIFIYLLPAYYGMSMFIGYGTDRLRDQFPRLARPVLIYGVLSVLLLPILNFNDMRRATASPERKDVEHILSVAGNRAAILTFSYHYAMFMSYYTIGEGREEQDSLFVYFRHVEQGPELTIASFVDPVVRYVKEGEPLFLANQRKYLPNGLDVYYYEWEFLVPSTRMNSIADRFPDFFYLQLESSLFRPARERFRTAGVKMDSVAPHLYKLSSVP